MRAGGNCLVQQALTAEAAGVVKQAVVLAKRRGHAQVTPLHVANTMLAAASGVFRVACLESNSHPLQCKALELCFNVALNRLPASAANPILHHSPNPAISNALVAAFKRAQAHQRRGSVESQQQPLAVKIELEQLIISILDDPSVSRVMREAGFSSIQVKNNVEKSISLELCSSQTLPSPSPKEINNNSINVLSLQPSSIKQTPPSRDEDLEEIINTLLMKKRRRSIVLVGENISNLEATIKGLMDKVEKRDVPQVLQELKFISIPPLYSCNLHRDKVALKIRELTCLVQSLVGKGVVLCLGDLKWISDYRASLEREGSYYSSVEHMIMEIGRLVWVIGENEKFWMMGIATFQTYMRCRNGYHSLQTVWGLHPLTIPVNSLGFSLVSESDEKCEDRSNGHSNEEAKLSWCKECSKKFESEARELQERANEVALSRLPSWLKDETRLTPNDKDQNSEAMRELTKKWDSFCRSAHKQPTSMAGTQILSSAPISSSNSSRKHFLSQNWGSNSACSGEIMDVDKDNIQKFKEFNSEHLNILCNALEEKVPWQKEIIPEISGTVLQCRSGMLIRKTENHTTDVKEETWLLFLGRDESQAKEKIARELAKVVFGSYGSFVSIGLSRFVSPAKADSSEDCRNKRGRDACKSYIDRFAQAVAADPRRVFLMEDLEQADYCSQIGVKRAIERGRIVNENGEEVCFRDAIVVLSCESFRSKSRASSPNQRTENGSDDGGEEEEAGGGGLLDLNISLGDKDGEENQSVDDLGILENVDRRVVFKIQDWR